ncbi:Holliday junction resolvase-like protein [Hymenobacter setariae]|nr:Holliday junction resolvase-like protein [Hymenobacter setariae]
MEASTAVAFVITIICLVLYYFKNKELAVQKAKEESFRKEIEAIQTKLNDAYQTIPKLANQQFEEFRRNELDILQVTLAESAKKSALAELETWKIQNEAFYRQDAINRSQAVILGKVTEHLVPFQNGFPFNPKEARFIGSPIDIIVFDGIDNEDIVDIYILEIKTGNSSLNKRQRLIRDAVLNKRVHWRELNV